MTIATERPTDGWGLEFFAGGNGHSSVAEFIREVPAPGRAQTARYLQLLQRSGPQLGMPYTRHVQGKVWELRPGRYRLLYFAGASRRFIVLHVFRKNSNRTPQKEIDQALRRLDNLLSQARQT